MRSVCPKGVQRLVALIILISSSLFASCSKYAADSCGTLAGPTLEVFKLATTNMTEAEDVSIIQLITSPHSFNGRVIMAGGYLSIATEREALSLMPDGDDRASKKESIWVEFSDEWCEKLIRYSGKYCLIVGTFDEREKGHFSSYAGGLTNVLRIAVYDKKRYAPAK